MGGGGGGGGVYFLLFKLTNFPMGSTNWLDSTLILCPAITFPAEAVLCNFTMGGEVGCFHCILCCLVSGSKWWTQVSSKVICSENVKYLPCRARDYHVKFVVELA